MAYLGLRVLLYVSSLAHNIPPSIPLQRNQGLKKFQLHDHLLLPNFIYESLA